jgi:NAD(P)-dependent dehydrogenase (short-subunit alcohol dehydrogenase family)
MVSQEKVALIVGAATGIGNYAAKKLALNGVKVVIADINDQDGAETVEEIIKLGQQAAFVHTDVCSVDELEHAVNFTVETYGKIDIYWYNAGVIIQGHIDLVNETGFDKQMAVNLKGALFGTKFAIRELRRTGGGCILYTGSMVGLKPNPYEPAYSLPYMLSKSCLVMLMRSLVEFLAKDNIRINCICPGPVQTPRWTADLSKAAALENISADEVAERKAARIPLAKVIAMEDVANAALFLVSEKASMINGVVLPVDGGYAAL